MKEIKKKNWYVFYTSPRAEKKVNEYLLSLGAMNLFCHSKANLRFGEIDNVNLSSHLSSQAIFLF